MTTADLRVRPNLRFYVVVALMLITLVTGLATSFYLFSRLFYVLGFALVVSYVWVLISVRYLKVKVHRSRQQVNVSESVLVTITLTNQSKLPKQDLIVNDLNDIPGASGGVVVGLPAKSYRTWDIETITRVRGIYDLGPVKVTNTDPFGLLTATRVYGDTSGITVLPKVHSLPLIELPDPYTTGDSLARRRSYYIAPHASSVRDYVTGDSLSRVHWNSTARLGKLMSKEFDLGSSSEIWILLDLHRDFQAGKLEQSTDEYAASIAASIATRYSQSGLPVGFLSYGDQRYFLTAETGVGQQQRILQLTAVCRPKGDKPLEVVLPQEELLWKHGSFLVIITSSPRTAWTTAASTLSKRGIKLVVVLIDGQSFGGEISVTAALENLTSTGIPTYLIKKGDDIPTALSRNYNVHKSTFDSPETLVG